MLRDYSCRLTLNSKTRKEMKTMLSVDLSFWEILTRIAKLKFVDQGKSSSIDRAFELLLNSHVFNYLGFQNRESWQLFREEQLWTVKVNDIYDINLHILD
jgi:hypothetical protein